MKKALATLLMSLFFTHQQPGGPAVTGSNAAQITPLFVMWETGNVNASNGDVPNRDFYTNCATSCSAGAWQPVTSGIVSNGQLACTTTAQSSGVTNGCTARSVVATTLSGIGTHALDNGKGAGGVDSATAMTETYGGATANPCAANFGQMSGVTPGLTTPNDITNWMAAYSISTAATNFNTSFLGPSKHTMLQSLSDSLFHYVGFYCFIVDNVSATGDHLEFDINHTDHVDNYHGPGTHYVWSTQKLYYCFQGCSSWKEMDIKEANGTVHSTHSWPVNHAIFIAIADHRDVGCTHTSGSNCDWEDRACFQDVTAGTAMYCGDLIDAVSLTTPGAIPVLKSGFTTDEINTQTQIDVADNSVTINVKAWKVLVAY